MLVAFLCIIMLFSMTACRKNITHYSSDNSSDIYKSESLDVTVNDENTSSTDGNNSVTSSIIDSSGETTQLPSTNSDLINSSTTSSTQSEESHSYKDIVCTKITDFQQVSFSTSDSNLTMFVTIPKDWEFEKSNGGYNIIKNSKSIGTVTTSIKTPSNETVNVFTSQITTNNISVTHNIDQIAAEKTPSYTRTFCYNYTDENGKNKNIFITIPYQETDSSATYKIITEAKMVKASTSTNLGILKINDNRNKILILGNSFINSSQIGNILQTMCGDEATVEAVSRGYAHVETYTADAQIMQNIRNGKYSVVFICGLYNQVSFDALQLMINACKTSDTKLAVFPAHNENQQNIERVMSMYPDTVFINWKAEIESLISTGIDVSNFCIPDAHNHSTPLAGYVGAHMIYRAVFNKIPQTTQFVEPAKSEIDLLGDYVTTGTIDLLDINSIFVLD